jgi:predicted CopG family antitoxin
MDEILKKNIAIKPFVYDKPVALRHGNDTFSDVIERLIDGGDLHVWEKNS